MRRAGLSLVELLVAVSIMGIIAGTLGGLAMAVQMSAEFNHANGTALQHGRVVIGRIERTVLGATTSAEFPGVVAFSNTVGSWDFPDTLVVWSPEATAVDPDGLPKMNELLFYYPDPNNPEILSEVRVTNTRTAPAISATSLWVAEIANIKNGRSQTRTELTNLLRVADVVDNSTNSLFQRGGVRFEVDYRPSNAEWAALQANILDWEDMTWPQSLYGGNYGLRQAWCRIELQLRTTNEANNSTEESQPLFGSASLFYQVEKP